MESRTDRDVPWIRGRTTIKCFCKKNPGLSVLTEKNLKRKSPWILWLSFFKTTFSMILRNWDRLFSLIYHLAQDLYFICKIYDLKWDIWTIYCLHSETDNLKKNILISFNIYNKTQTYPSSGPRSVSQNMKRNVEEESRVGSRHRILAELSPHYMSMHSCFVSGALQLDKIICNLVKQIACPNCFKTLLSIQSHGSRMAAGLNLRDRMWFGWAGWLAG